MISFFFCETSREIGSKIKKGLFHFTHQFTFECKLGSHQIKYVHRLCLLHQVSIFFKCAGTILNLKRKSKWLTFQSVEMEFWQPLSLAKNLYVEVILISSFVSSQKGLFLLKSDEMVLISIIMILHSVFVLPDYQAVMISFRKISNNDKGYRPRQVVFRSNSQCNP